MSRGRLLDAGLALGALATLTLAAAMAPGVAGPACPLRAATGHMCPFCGMTRSFVALFEGDVGGSFAAHPGGPILAVAMIVLAAAVVVAAVRRAAPIVSRRRAVRALEGVAVVCAVLGAVSHI